jgi:hypothetical protein
MPEASGPYQDPVEQLRAEVWAVWLEVDRVRRFELEQAGDREAAARQTRALLRAHDRWTGSPWTGGPPTARSVFQEALGQRALSATRAERAARAGLELPAHRLRRRLGLADRHLRALWIAVAVELDRDLRALVADVAALGGGHGVSADLMARLADDLPGQHAEHALDLAPGSPLLESALLLESPPASRVFRPAERLLAWLCGDCDQLDPGVASVIDLDETAPLDAKPLEGPVERILASSSPVIGVIRGACVSDRRQFLATAARRVGRSLAFVDLAALLDRRDRLPAAVRELRLLARVPVLERVPDRLAEAVRSAISRLAGMEGPLFLGIDGGDPPHPDELGRPTCLIELELPSVARRRQLWSESLGPIDVDVAGLAQRHPLTASAIRRIGALAVAVGASGMTTIERLLALETSRPRRDPGR